MALGWKWLIPLALANIVVVALAILLFPGRTTGLVWLSWIFGGLFVLMFLLSKLRQALDAPGPPRGRAPAAGRLIPWP